MTCARPRRQCTDHPSDYLVKVEAVSLPDEWCRVTSLSSLSVSSFSRCRGGRLRQKMGAGAGPASDGSMSVLSDDCVASTIGKEEKSDGQVASEHDLVASDMEFVLTKEGVVRTRRWKLSASMSYGYRALQGTDLVM
ncbi:hypothetical protein TREMEDRAFT_65308 [Tremella mesenterica DSM 1558]|uniref:uncharacterized protein n=1 Tax=Tremella mesenterica (strain ATCC 24925 / CBS 8224 / DSM 1558 / NBRC 9311 / NRRL Y-6157 / RJB 2259-6 / UBC 559-6) TaxID=578456 RepID=UPI00032D6594|nr:uncharacterized protein TREMEDRAFT_65308 [Tremella mesenterica DSM 1558]EIW66450.1 hypothetical protein TREMEDRAFT_65308 [Tremella mesenterica DSM 1558]